MGRTVRQNKCMNRLSTFLQVRWSTLQEAARRRKSLEETEELKPILARLARKVPEGDGIVSPQWIMVVAELMESEKCSDVVKGAHAVYKEKVRSNTGDFVIYRQKKVLKLSPLQLFELAKQELKWPFSARTLLRLTPPWFTHPRNRILLGCLCSECTNLQLKLRVLSQLATSLKLGTGKEKNQMETFELSVSISGFFKTGSS